jgi:heat shock protein HslJ
MSTDAAALEDATTPEGFDWRLTGYLDPDAESTAESEDGSNRELTPVPLGVSATLRLESGQATGSGGCNTFGGGYAVDGTSLTVMDIVSTLVLCEDGVQAIEDAYLDALGKARGWLINAGVLELADESGTTLLTFEIPDVSLTSSELAGLVATLDSLATEIASLREDVEGLGDDVTALGVGAQRSRERIRALETMTQRLDRLLELPTEEAPDPPAGFNAAERVLLEGIPGRIAGRCQPLRSGRPVGTRAAVRCRPDTQAVSRVDYFLMDGPDAAAAFRDDMAAHDVSEAVSDGQTCAEGRRSWMNLIGGGWQAEGCYRADGVAHVRFVDNATDCRQLAVPGGRRLRNPAILMALQGTSSDIARVRDWAVGDGGDAGLITRISRHIERPSQPRSPGCVT